MARANYFLSREQLDNALAEVSKLEGEPREMLASFYEKGQASLTMAQSVRLAAIQTANVLYELSRSSQPKSETNTQSDAQRDDANANTEGDTEVNTNTERDN